MDRQSLMALARTALPVVAVLSLVLGVGFTLAFAGDTLGFDFLAYHQAAVRLLGGQPLYDMSFTETGGFGLFYYPPTFAPVLLPFGLLDGLTATWAWLAISVAIFLVGVAALPASRTVRWWIILLAGWSFPFVYAVKLGQVGPILFGLFALGWRWSDHPGWLGVTGALGSAIKIQPGLVLVWALLTRRWRAVVIGGVSLIVLAVVATLLAGLGAWTDFITLLRTVSDPITTEHNFTPGAVAFQAGMTRETAALIQLASTILVVAITLAGVRWATDEASYLMTAVASQLISPILWDHYAMLLLLPVAYLLSAGRWWAALIPLVTAWPLVGVTPPLVYPVVFWATLIVTFLVGHAARDPRTSIGERWAA
jgi:alpha-1,2-mannosyltransferase